MTDTFIKQPSEILDYMVEADNFFEDNPQDDISSVVVTVTGTGIAPDLVVGPNALPETQLLGSPPQDFKVWLGDGTNGVTYKVTTVMTTADGRVKEHEFKIKVKDR